jgi:CheY-like chemotaxis protein
VKNIYLIDDDPVFVFLTKKMIRSNGEYRISQFTDGELALEHLRTIFNDPAGLPDIILLDLSMPVMDGWEFLNQYSEWKTGIAKPITLFIVSSSISPQELERSRTYPVVSDFLIKPLQVGKLREIVSAG